MVCSPNGDTDFFDTVSGILQDPLESYLLSICREYVLRTSIVFIKENDLIFKKISRRNPAETTSNADYAEDLALLANTLSQSLEQAVRDICVHVNANKTKFMRFKQDAGISTLSNKTLTLVKPVSLHQ